MIDSKTKIVGILGWPVGHSLSPQIHNASFAELGLHYAYVPLPVEAENLAAAIGGIRAMNFAGANVTIPHKVTVIPFLDQVDAVAQQIGAVNTIVNRNGMLSGYNTDAEGFIRSLAAEGVSVQNRKAAVLGAGGAAQAVICGLMAYGAGRITIAARSAEKAAACAGMFHSVQIESLCWQDLVYADVLQQCDLLINCTPLGMYPHSDGEPPVDWKILNPKAVVCDLIYNPSATQFLLHARHSGHQTVNGAGMLIEQGALAFTLWTGMEAPRHKMREVFMKM